MDRQREANEERVAREVEEALNKQREEIEGRVRRDVRRDVIEVQDK